MNTDEEFDIRQYLAALKRRAATILICFFVCTIATAVVTLVEPKKYTAVATVVISAQQDLAGSGTALSDPNQLQNQMDTEVQVAKSPAVEQLANRILGTQSAEIDSISANGVSGTRVMSIKATSESKIVAQAAANAYSSAYQRIGQQQDVDRVLSIGETVTQKQQELQSQLDDLNGQIERNPPNAASLKYRVSAVQAQITQLQNQYNTVQAQAIARDNAATQLAEARLPESASSPRPLRDIAAAAALGLIIGCGLALIRDRFDDRVRSAEQVRRWLPKVAQLGSIPKVQNWKNESEAKTVTLLDPQSQAAEAYRGLRTSIEFAALEQPLSVIEVTSAAAGEGKSTTIANLATTLAWAGKKVVIVSGDLRRPRLHHFFGQNNGSGITSVLLGEHELPDVLQPVDVGNGGIVHILPTGPLPPNPSEVLASKAMGELVQKLKSHADFVLIDAPPLLPVADPLVLSKYVDGIVFVAGARSTRKRHIDRAMEILGKSTTTPLLGLVVNGVEGDLGYSSRYRYYGTDSSHTSMEAIDVSAVSDASTSETVDVTVEKSGDSAGSALASNK